jgi:UPF0755 protein
MPRTRRYKKRKSYNQRSRVPIVVTAVVVVAAIVLGTQFMAYNDAQKPVDPNDTSMVAVEIGEGIGLDGIASLLEQKGIIKSARFFELRSTLERTGGKYKAGSYEFSKSMRMDEIMQILVEGAHPDVVKFTVLEGLTTKQTMQSLVEAGLMTEEEFWNEVENGQFDYRFLEGAPAGRERLDGFLYPETYEVFKDDDAHKVIDTLLAQFDGKLTDADYKRAAKQKRTVREVVTIASLIERETAVADERPRVARVIYNRIKKDMPLQIDAAIQYLLDSPKERLTEKDLEIDSPYNLYKNKGLPPGPICSPRMECVTAALHPEKNNYIYYVLDPALNGMHRFSESYDEFLADKAAYKEALAERDGGA